MCRPEHRLIGEDWVVVEVDDGARRQQVLLDRGHFCSLSARMTRTSWFARMPPRRLPIQSEPRPWLGAEAKVPSPRATGPSHAKAKGRTVERSPVATAGT